MSRKARLRTSSVAATSVPDAIFGFSYGSLSKRQATITGLSSKGYWHLSWTLATQTGMTNDWLRRQGLISVRDLWVKAHGYA